MELAAPHPDMAVLQPQPGPHEGAVHAGTTVAGTGPLTPPSLIWVPHFLFLTRLSKPSVSSCKRPAHAVHASCPRWICGLGPMEGMVLFGWYQEALVQTSLRSPHSLRKQAQMGAHL